MKTQKRSFHFFLAAIVLLAVASCEFKSETKSNTDSAGTGSSAQVLDTITTKVPIGTNSQVTEPNKSTTSNQKSSTHYRKWKTTIGGISQNKSAKNQVSSSGIYEYTELQPAYPGGEQAMQDFISNNIIYPEVALNNEAQGTVRVQFTIDEKGNVSDVHSLDLLGNGLDDEAVRVVSIMPKWTAGSVKKKSVKSKITIPITFRIEQ
jgi:TonB family protein